MVIQIEDVLNVCDMFNIAYTMYDPSKHLLLTHGFTVAFMNFYWPSTLGFVTDVQIFPLSHDEFQNPLLF